MGVSVGVGVDGVGVSSVNSDWSKKVGRLVRTTRTRKMFPFLEKKRKKGSLEQQEQGKCFLSWKKEAFGKLSPYWTVSSTPSCQCPVNFSAIPIYSNKIIRDE